MTLRQIKTEIKGMEERGGIEIDADHDFVVNAISHWLKKLHIKNMPPVGDSPNAWGRFQDREDAIAAVEERCQGLLDDFVDEAL